MEFILPDYIDVRSVDFVNWLDEYTRRAPSQPFRIHPYRSQSMDGILQQDLVTSQAARNVHEQVS